MKSQNFFFLLVSFLMLMTGTISAQVEISKQIETINGKKFYIHEVKQGQTVYSIAKAYKVTQDDIFKHNDHARDGIKPGEKLKIPFSGNETVPQPEVKSETEYFTHVVSEGESLGKIAAKYKTSLSEIRKLNVGISDQIKPGQKIKIPGKEPEKELVPVFHVVKQGESLFSIARDYKTSVEAIRKLNPGMSESLRPGDKIKVSSGSAGETDIKQSDKTDCLHPKKLDEYHVALLIPLYLNKAEAIKFEEGDKNENEFKQHASFTYIQFYEGMKLAMDSVSKLGLNVIFHVYDVAMDSSNMASFLDKPELKKMNLILGPFTSKHLSAFQKFSSENRIPFVSCYLTDESNEATDMSYHIRPIPSIAMQVEGLASYFPEKYKEANIIIAYQNSDLERNAAKTLDSLLKIRKYSGTVKLIDYTALGLGGVTSLFTKGQNVVVSLITGEIAVSNYIRNMSTYRKNYDITLFGLPGWLRYENLDMEFLEYLNTHFFASGFASMEDENVREFMRNFQKVYSCDPDKYAFAGYDFTLFFSKALANFGPDFMTCIEGKEYQGLYYHFHFRKATDGIENQSIRVYRMKDFQLWEAE